ncbi:MAG: aldehyde dehydrogenase family protein [Actinomycetota bacterium]
MSENRLEIRKTYKLLVNGAFPRSESGRTYEVVDAEGKFIANVAQASRKDLREAVVAARAAQAKWWSQSAYNRGQVIYRLAEMAESRHAEIAEAVELSEGVKSKEARKSVSRGIDRMVWYAGWTDKIAQVFGGANPVAGPFFNFSLPVPSGVVAAVAHPTNSFEGLIDVTFGAIAAGNSVIVLASSDRPVPAVLLGEMSAVSDFPGGVLNILTGKVEELAPVMASHEDIDGLDIGCVQATEHTALISAAAGSIKRVFEGQGFDETTAVRRLRTFIETSTVWHTKGQ